MKTILEICREVADLAAVKRPNNLFNDSGQQDSIFLSEGFYNEGRMI